MKYRPHSFWLHPRPGRDSRRHKRGNLSSEGRLRKCSVVPGRDDTGAWLCSDRRKAYQYYKFMHVIELFAKDTGFGNEYHICSFASSWNPLEEGYFESGVQFIDATGRDEKSVIVDYFTFYKFLSMACEEYLTRYPQDRNKVEEALKAIRERYNL